MGDSRYAVPIGDLEATAQVAPAELVTEQTPRGAPPPLAPSVHPFGDGATPDGDGD
jgi:hypothetical protein